MERILEPGAIVESLVIGLFPILGARAQTTHPPPGAAGLWRLHLKRSGSLYEHLCTECAPATR